jgi:hypothetical protein
MRADYPGAKVTFRSKHNKWIPRLATNSTLSSANAKITRSVTDEISQSQQAPLPLKSHQKLIRTLPYRRESTAADADSPDLNAQTARLLFIEIAHEVKIISFFK